MKEDLTSHPYQKSPQFPHQKPNKAFPYLFLGLVGFITSHVMIDSIIHPPNQTLSNSNEAIANESSIQKFPTLK